MYFIRIARNILFSVFFFFFYPYTLPRDHSYITLFESLRKTMKLLSTFSRFVCADLKSYQTSLVERRNVGK